LVAIDAPLATGALGTTNDDDRGVIGAETVEVVELGLGTNEGAEDEATEVVTTGAAAALLVEMTGTVEVLIAAAIAGAVLAFFRDSARRLRQRNEH
jgi:hypothetical protein